MNTDSWRKYARCWSAADSDRAASLKAQVAEDVRYRDPNADLQGIGGLSAYMAGFQGAFPGHRFEIDSVVSHHDRSLARWRQVDAIGGFVSEGISFATHHDDGKFSDVTGFFLAASS
jgi:hypothetical protein